MQPLYFLAGVDAANLAPGNRLNRSILESRGIAEAFSDVGDGDHACSQLSGRGPGDRSGCILSYITPAGQAARRVGFYPDEQQWTQVGTDVWIGIDFADRPKPDELRRRQTSDGYWVELADGQRYAIPVIRRRDGSSNLPTDMATNPLTGRFEESIKPRYAKYWEQAAIAAEWFFGEHGFDGPTFDKSQALQMAIMALSLNYRVGPLEQFVLRLVDSSNFLEVLAAAVDVHGTLIGAESQPPASPTVLETGSEEE